MTHFKDYLTDKHFEKEITQDVEEWIESISNEDMEHYLYHYVMSQGESGSAIIAKILLTNQ